MRSDMAPAKKFGWSTVLVLEELRVAGYAHYHPKSHINDFEVEGVDGEHVAWGRFDEVSLLPWPRRQRLLFSMFVHNFN